MVEVDKQTNSLEIESVAGIEDVLEDVIAVVACIKAETVTGVEADAVPLTFEVGPMEQHSCCMVSHFLLRDKSENHRDHPVCWVKLELDLYFD